MHQDVLFFVKIDTHDISWLSDNALIWIPLHRLLFHEISWYSNVPQWVFCLRIRISFKLFHPKNVEAFAGRSMDVLLGVLDSLEVAEGLPQLVDPSHLTGVVPTYYLVRDCERFFPHLAGSRRIHGLHGSMWTDNAIGKCEARTMILTVANLRQIIHHCQTHAFLLSGRI